jgi:transposase
VGGAFEELLSSCFVDHRVTSPFHPQANGLAERVVQVVKRSLRKLCETRSTTQWDQRAAVGSAGVQVQAGRAGQGAVPMSCCMPGNRFCPQQ